MKVSNEQAEPRQECALNIFLLPKGLSWTWGLLLRDPRSWFMFTGIMVPVLFFISWMVAVDELLHRAGLFSVIAPDGSIRWARLAEVLSTMVMFMGIGISGLMCVWARRHSLRPVDHLTFVLIFVIPLAGGSYVSIMTLLKVM